MGRLPLQSTVVDARMCRKKDCTSCDFSDGLESSFGNRLAQSVKQT